MKKRLLAMLTAIVMTFSFAVTTSANITSDNWRSKNVNPVLLENPQANFVFSMFWVIRILNNEVELRTDERNALLAMAPNSSLSVHERLLEVSQKLLGIAIGRNEFLNCISVLEDCDCVYCDDCGKTTMIASEKETKSFVCTCNIVCTFCWEEDCNYAKGHVTGGDSISIDDALQILRYIVGLYTNNSLAWAVETENCARNAALIVSEETPGIADALQILRHLVDLPSALD
ncbi:MAG: hypothetical protein FWF76_06845 [Oscillospiraceae bacterium]|nr:hypothetical protein [Oscillospiraceae bacterium]